MRDDNKIPLFNIISHKILQKKVPNVNLFEAASTLQGKAEI